MNLEGNQRSMRVRIESLDQLRVMANRDEPVDIGITFQRGDEVLRSSKRIHYRRNRNGRHWFLWEGITDTERYYTTPQLRRQTNIVEAIEKGACSCEIDLHAKQGNKE